MRPWGSSPHTRGLPENYVRDDLTHRIIPAHAGFTPGFECGPYWEEDHPRTRGVYPHSVHHARGRPGSSPHTRGLPLQCPAFTGRRRIIPAHAGFTFAQDLRLGRELDHPRTRGVYITYSVRMTPLTGSSPHTRGLLLNSVGTHIGVRIIPAHAGFTYTNQRSANENADHPRTRGVYGYFCVLRRPYCGSSPHTRGLLVKKNRAHQRRRIIPAHAGFTIPRGFFFR